MFADVEDIYRNGTTRVTYDGQRDDLLQWRDAEAADNMGCEGQVHFCAYWPVGNGIVERMHQTIKWMVALSGCSVEEMTFWYNATRGKQLASPFKMVFSARPQMPGVMDWRVKIEWNWVEAQPVGSNTCSAAEDNLFTMGDVVFLQRGPACDQLWSGPHHVMGVPSAVSVTLDGGDVPHHVSHI